MRVSLLARGALSRYTRGNLAPVSELPRARHE
jgi:hypothetical protein